MHCPSPICQPCAVVTLTRALLASIQTSASPHLASAQSAPLQLIAQSEAQTMGACRCDEAVLCASEASPKCITAGSSSASTSRCCLPQVRQTPPDDIYQQHPCSSHGLHQGKGESLKSSESAQTRLRAASGCCVQVPAAAHAQLPPAASQRW